MSEYIVNMGDEHESPFPVLVKLSKVSSYAEVREEIVRCRDCVNCEYREHLGRSYCCGEYATEPDGFCAWGERRGE